MKVADADAGVLAHFHELNEARRKAGLRVRLLQDLLTWAAGNLSDLGVGVVLLLSGGAIRAGIFTIGDFSLFITYLWFIIRFPSHTGGMLADGPMRKLLRLRSVWAPQYLSAGTCTSPIVSFSMRYSMVVRYAGTAGPAMLTTGP